MTTRTGGIDSLVFSQGRKGGFKRLLIAFAVIAGLLGYVAGKVHIVRLGYAIEALEREKQEIERANRSLLIEASSLSAPARIEEIAVKRLGMVRPPKENVVVVKRRAAPKP